MNFNLSDMTIIQITSLASFIKHFLDLSLILVQLARELTCPGWFPFAVLQPCSLGHNGEVVQVARRQPIKSVGSSIFVHNTAMN